jgi:hypothetical protein
VSTPTTSSSPLLLLHLPVIPPTNELKVEDKLEIALSSPVSIPIILFNPVNNINFISDKIDIEALEELGVDGVVTGPPDSLSLPKSLPTPGILLSWSPIKSEGLVRTSKKVLNVFFNLSKLNDSLTQSVISVTLVIKNLTHLIGQVI